MSCPVPPVPPGPAAERGAPAPAASRPACPCLQPGPGSLRCGLQGHARGSGLQRSRSPAKRSRQKATIFFFSFPPLPLKFCGVRPISAREVRGTEDGSDSYQGNPPAPSLSPASPVNLPGARPPRTPPELGRLRSRSQTRAGSAARRAAPRTG